MGQRHHTTTSMTHLLNLALHIAQTNDANDDQQAGRSTHNQIVSGIGAPSNLDG